MRACRTRRLTGLSETPPLYRPSRTPEGTTLRSPHTGRLQVPLTQAHGQSPLPMPVPASSWGHSVPTAGCRVSASSTPYLLPNPDILLITLNFCGFFSQSWFLLI